MRHYLPLLLILSLYTCVRAQIGLHPPELDFKQLQSEHARIIFPEGFEARAARVAAMIDSLQANHTRSIGEKIYDFDLVLQTATTEINGYVGLAPFRSEFYTTPPQSMNLLGNMDWVDQLTIHEYRHVQQNSNERRGLTNLMSYLQGQRGWSVVSFLATPNWFSEGDAVIYESALSKNGRGRTPAFSATLRSLLADDTVYRYAKARNGSFDELVPDHYRFGYATLTYARERFGNDVWKKVLHRGAAQGGILYSFSRALKRETGYGTKELYRLAQQDLKTRQDSALAARGPLVEGQPFGQQRKEVTTYRMPFVDDQGRVIALRSGFVNTPELVVVKDGEKDEVLTSVGIQREPYFHLQGRNAVWTEDRQNPRYTNQNYSDIFIYDLEDDRKRRLTTKGKYFSPALSFDRQAIVAVEHNPLTGPPAIVVLASNTGEVIHRVEIRATAVSFPRFAPDGKTIYYYNRNPSGTSLRALDIATEEIRLLWAPSADPFDYLQVTEAGKIIFSNGRDGIDNAYQFDPRTERITRLSNVGIGALFPYLTPAGDLYYTEATSLGGRLRRLAGAAGSAAKTGVKYDDLPVGESIFERPAAFTKEAYDITRTEADANDYEISNFSDKLGGINLHSWSFNGSYVRPGMTVEATNALNTIRLSADATINIEESRPTFGFNVEYGGWLPVIDLSVNTSGRNYSNLDFQPDTIVRNNFDFEQQQLAVGASLPLRWVAGDYLSALTPGLSVNYTRVGETEGEVPTPDDFLGIGTQLQASILRRTARKQVQSRLGVSVRWNYDRALGGNAGERLLMRHQLFLPGIFPTHGLRLDFDYQRQSARGNYQYVNAFQYARGYGAGFNDRVSRLGVNYQLPLLYPDFGILGVTYFQRVRLNAFFDRDMSVLEGANLRRPTRSSAGGQFFFDNVWLNSAPITVGMELAYLLDRLPGEDVVNFRFLVSGGF